MTNQQPNPSQSTDAINSANTTATDINLPTANTIHDNHTTITDAGGIAHAVQAKLAKLEEGSSSIDIRHGTHLGKPTVFFSAEDYFVNLAKDCKYTIIEKFYKGKPSMEEIRKGFVEIGKSHMKIIKWTADFKPEEETSIVPIWILIHQLPWHLFKWQVISRLISDIGVAICSDPKSPLGTLHGA
ncbi:hypothetical protein FXO38_33130 [Capsicum annuum]|nr:hypothetical protein FXO38_33130 [Capsicum annuum]KAF3682828.1 hypothetical protein FXO37_02131 [Capsicum annuum]